MKKFSIFLVAMLVAVSASAQLVTSSSSMTVKQPKEDRTTWVLRAGLGINNFSFGEDDDEIGAKIGYNLDWSFNHKMGNKGAYWGMSWGFGSRGYKIDEGEDYKESLSAHNIHYSPFIFGWKIQCGSSKVAIDPHVGIYMAVDYIGKYKYEYMSTETVQVGTEYVYGYSFPKYENRQVKVEGDHSIWDEDDYMPFDMGLKLGVGVWFNDKVNLDFTWQRGLIPLYLIDELDYSDNAFTNNFQISVGIGF